MMSKILIRFTEKIIIITLLIKKKKTILESLELDRTKQSDVGRWRFVPRQQTYQISSDQMHSNPQVEQSWFLTLRIDALIGERADWLPPRPCTHNAHKKAHDFFLFLRIVLFIFIVLTYIFIFSSCFLIRIL